MSLMFRLNLTFLKNHQHLKFHLNQMSLMFRLNLTFLMNHLILKFLTNHLNH